MSETPVPPCPTRQRILAAALTVIGEKGYSAATVDEIVKVAGVSKGLVYYHFKNKAAIATAILEEGVESLINKYLQIDEKSPDVKTALTNMVVVFASYVFDQKDFARFFLSELWREGRAWSPAMRRYEHQLRDILVGQIIRGQREKLFRPKMDPPFVANVLIDILLTSALHHVSDEQTESAALSTPEETKPVAALSEKEVYIERVSDFIRHAILRPELLIP